MNLKTFQIIRNSQNYLQGNLFHQHKYDDEDDDDD